VVGAHGQQAGANGLDHAPPARRRARRFQRRVPECLREHYPQATLGDVRPGRPSIAQYSVPALRVGRGRRGGARLQRVRLGDHADAARRDAVAIRGRPRREAGRPSALPYEIEPDPAKLLNVLVPKAVEVGVFRALLENQSGEHAARMAAMEAATRNTEELIDRSRCNTTEPAGAITKELVEIVSGAEAL
jgi:hypothetical protein